MVDAQLLLTSPPPALAMDFLLLIFLLAIQNNKIHPQKEPQVSSWFKSTLQKPFHQAAKPRMLWRMPSSDKPQIE